ncbi:hypothetical protein HanXRQr2_Chr10g0454641 [Helianthus annuus]|uniref:Uncharacterized protein n=1 Tax=Helianthus annuus TaxID=4232 RepID=A0A9K3I0B8_HELAN|nr:hypothetical protein HanXRQr2_Chr10g0454641 [Helianthus annuus]KAJ0884889.1 hypothetical protein HanPSC8_Chr10g0439041 [Helianthus annuus]
MQIRIQKKQLTVTHMKVSWLVMGLGMTVACVSKSLVYVLSNKIGRRARVYAFFLFLFYVFFLRRHLFSLLFGRQVLPRKQLMVHGLIKFKHAPL